MLADPLCPLAPAGGHAATVLGDPMQDAAADRIVAESQAAFDGIDILVNNAGGTSVGATSAT